MASLSLFSPLIPSSPSISLTLRSRHPHASPVRYSLTAWPVVIAAPPDLVESILSKVRGTDRGVQLTKQTHQEVANVALQLAQYCVNAPVKCPLIFGEWDVVYCSNPTSPGGGYRTAIGLAYLQNK